MSMAYRAHLETCQRHAARLVWAMAALRSRFPLTASAIKALSDADLAILDQFSTRFAKLQDAMGAKLFSAVLELSKETDNYPAFLDKLNQLEKIGAIKSSTQWLTLREMRNQFAHDYPDDSELQAAILNKAYVLANELLAVLEQIEKFASAYLTTSSKL